MDTPSVPSAPLFNAFMQDLAKQLVPLIVTELKHQTNAEGMGMIALDPNNLSLPVYTLISQDDSIRDTIRDMIDDRISDKVDAEFRSMQRKIDELDEKVDSFDSRIDDLEEHDSDSTPIDADNSDFQDAVCSVIRNHI